MEQGTFSWKRGLKHAGLAMLVVIIALGLVVVFADVKNPEKFGEGTGQFSLFVGLAALGISYKLQTRKR